MTENEYNHCVREHADGVFRFILKNLRNREDARDVVQSAFEKMWKSRNSVDGTKGKAFLFTVAYHQMIDHLRKNKTAVCGEETIPEAATQDRYTGDTKKVLHDALARLSETQRSLVMLKDYEGYSYEEIGDIMGLSPSQVKVYLHRARIQLKKYIVRPENVTEW